MFSFRDSRYARFRRVNCPSVPALVASGFNRAIAAKRDSLDLQSKLGRPTKAGI
jgi:hypothetical protein